MREDARRPVIGHDAGMTDSSTSASGALTELEQQRLQRKVLIVLATGQVMGGLGVGATLALGALLVAEVSGSSALSGLAATMNTLGAAILAIPLARLAQRRGHGRGAQPARDQD